MHAETCHNVHWVSAEKGLSHHVFSLSFVWQLLMNDDVTHFWLIGQLWGQILKEKIDPVLSSYSPRATEQTPGPCSQPWLAGQASRTDSLQSCSALGIIPKGTENGGWAAWCKCREDIGLCCGGKRLALTWPENCTSFGRECLHPYGCELPFTVMTLPASKMWPNESQISNYAGGEQLRRV